MSAKSFILIILVVMMSIVLYGCGRNGGNDGGSSHSSSGNNNNINNNNNNNNTNNNNTNNTNNSNDNNDNNVVGIGNSGGNGKDIAYYEGLCKKYLGQPQKAGLPIPDTYADAIEYLNQTLFFFPDDPKDMTEEQKDLYSASCFWSGVKYRFAYNENSTTDADKIKGIAPFAYYIHGGVSGLARKNVQLVMPKFDEQMIKGIDRDFNYYRYIIFTRQFYNFFVNRTKLNIYCISLINNPNKGHSNCDTNPYRMFTTRFIDNTSSYFISRDPNATKGLRYSEHATGNKSVDPIEYYLLLRNLRFGSDDGRLMIAKIKDIDNTFAPASAVSAMGLRGNITISMDELREKSDSLAYNNVATFKPDWLAIFTALKNYGEASFDISRDYKNRLNEHYVSDYQLHDTEQAQIKNVTPKVIYFGIMPDYRIFLDNNIPMREYVVLHEVMHSMGFLHMGDYGSDMDVAYYINSVFTILNNATLQMSNKFGAELDNGNIKPYYHTTSQECISFDVTSNAIVHCQ